MDKKKQKFKMAGSGLILKQLKSHSKTSLKNGRYYHGIKALETCFPIETSIEKHVEYNN